MQSNTKQPKKTGMGYTNLPPEVWKAIQPLKDLLTTGQLLGRGNPVTSAVNYGLSEAVRECPNGNTKALTLVAAFLELDADPNYCPPANSNHLPPFMIAAMFGNLELMNLLQQYGADPHTTDNLQRNTADILKINSALLMHFEATMSYLATLGVRPHSDKKKKTDGP